MNINRNNYEEYFLLYADKELTPEEKNMVDIFIQQNPDLEEEFIMLQQSVLKPDNTIEIKNKGLLFKEDAFINQSNFEQKFLLYADNELSLSEIEKTEKFVLENSSMQNEFSVLQQLKYEPDTSIVLADKTFLYKKEGDTKIIPFRWKAMAAAVLLGIGLWTGISYLQKNNTKPPVAIVKRTVPKENIKTKINETKKDEANPLVKTNENEIMPTHKKAQERHDNSIQKPLQQNVVVKNIQLTDEKEEALKALDKKEEVIAVKEIPKKIETPKITGNQTDVTVSSEADKLITKATVLQNNNYAQPASYIEEAEIKSENYVFYNITAEEFRKSKVGKFLKKVKRAIERKIPLKSNSFKIVNVEIAKDQ